jgi:hypothetical protein
MTNETDRGRLKMAAAPFSPLPTGASHEGQVEHALNYIAFYLSEMEKHLAKIAGADPKDAQAPES